CETPGDTEGIGQVLERVGMDIDYISPMIYPSHYANSSRGMMGNGVGQSINGVVFTAPDLKPYEVVYNVLEKTKDRISKVENYKADVRPYIQGFTASYLPKGYYQVYGPEQIKQQIKAVYDAGFEEWIVWDAGNNYVEEAFTR
ncbi:MAG TPA: putative glycoside hydrolase, partial [Acetivibrio saccincola]|nr:putative glycoside hydrolase [Acetivibrio saccincola]